MQVQMLAANVVLLASNHNPSIASKDWLIANQIMSEAPTNFVHMPVVSQFDSENFNLLIEENRWQLIAKNVTLDVLEQLPEIATRYVKTLPETVYTAAGMNFELRTKDEQQNLFKRSQELFLGKSEKLSELASGDGARVSGVIQFWSEEFRVQVNCVPSPKEVRWKVNFHREISHAEVRVDVVEEALRKFHANMTYSEEVVRELMEPVEVES